ncbi:hypothetical protein Drorol1_Dr00003658 [Drosera rotundifolia]
MLLEIIDLLVMNPLIFLTFYPCFPLQHFLSPNFPPKSKSPKVGFRVCLLSSSSRPLQLTGIPKKIATFVSLILARWSQAIEEKISKLQSLGSCNFEELMCNLGLGRSVWNSSYCSALLLRFQMKSRGVTRLVENVMSVSGADDGTPSIEVKYGLDGYVFADFEALPTYGCCRSS